jgi:hypothetical protein
MMLFRFWTTTSTTHCLSISEKENYNLLDVSDLFADDFELILQASQKFDESYCAINFCECGD